MQQDRRELRDLLELVRQDLRVMQAQLEMAARLVRPGQQVGQVLKERRDKLVQLVWLVQAALRGQQDLPAALELRALRDQLVRPDQPAQLELSQP